MGEDRMPQVTQNVTTVNGFAYGVIGADVHVFDNGLPLLFARKLAGGARCSV